MSFTDVFKKIFGTKADRDMKAIRPLLDKVLVAYSEIDKLTDDELREKCQSLKDLIQERISNEEARIAEIKAELETEIPLSQKEKLATEADKLVKEVDKKIEEVLDQILPDAFAIMKSTARRFKENPEIRVKATDFDRNLSATKEFVTIDGDYAIWQNHWVAGGNEIKASVILFSAMLLPVILTVLVGAVHYGFVLAFLSVSLVLLQSASLFLTSKAAKRFVIYGKSGTMAGIINAALSFANVIASFVFPAVAQISSWRVVTVIWIAATLVSLILSILVYKRWTRFIDAQRD